jgi:hypothetical protein
MVNAAVYRYEQERQLLAPDAAESTPDESKE